MSKFVLYSKNLITGTKWIPEKVAHCFKCLKKKGRELANESPHLDYLITKEHGGVETRWFEGTLQPNGRMRWLSATRTPFNNNQP